MGAVTKIQSRGQITLPRDVRRASGFHAGDRVFVRSTGPGVAEIRVLPRMTFEESLRRFHVDTTVDMEQVKRDLEEDIIADVGRTLSND